MTVVIASHLTQRVYDWPDFKAVLAVKCSPLQAEEDDTLVRLWFYDGPEVFLCTLYKANIPPILIDNGFDTSSNDTYLADYNTNYKPTVNAPVLPKSKDGRPASRLSIANRMSTFKKRNMLLFTASASIHNVNPVTNADYGDLTVKLYNASNTLITDPADYPTATKTVVDWEPHYNYEIVGGSIDIPQALAGASTSNWFVSAVGVPDLPAEMYGSIDYISETCVEALTTSQIESDGRAVSYMPYQYAGIPGTNKLRFIIKHPAGESKRFQIHIEHYV